MYQLITDPMTGNSVSVKKQINADTVMSIPFDPANTDYQAFKQQINDETAQLQDAEGNLMSAQQAKAYVATLP